MNVPIVLGRINPRDVEEAAGNTGEGMVIGLVLIICCGVILLVIKGIVGVLFSLKIGPKYPDANHLTRERRRLGGEGG